MYAYVRNRKNQNKVTRGNSQSILRSDNSRHNDNNLHSQHSGNNRHSHRNQHNDNNRRSGKALYHIAPSFRSASPVQHVNRRDRAFECPS
jgi:hypothetical protein